jgi:glycosyltransferase involved in cell wall biosynthesis
MTATASAETVHVGSTATYAEKPLAVMLLISGLEHGGAERQVIELHKAMDRRRFEPFICSLSDHVPLAQNLQRGRDLVIVPKRWKYDASTIVRVGQLARARGVSVIHSFLFDAEIVARALRRTHVVPVVIASERNTDYAIGPLKSACLSMTRSWFDAMIANSAAGKNFNVRTVGIAPERIHVIRNGVDVERFRPTDGGALRARLGIPEHAPLVGMIASFKRQKRHHDFFHAASQLLQHVPDAWFMCVGEPLRDNQQGAGDYHAEMRHLVRSLGLEARMRFAGNQEDMPAAYGACQVTVLTSSREGTPNVLLESMACEVPVVATNIADNAVIVPDNEVGFIVPLGQPDQVADRLARLLRDGARRTAMGRAARAWVTREFSTLTLARRTEDVYTQVLRQRSALR